MAQASVKEPVLRPQDFKRIAELVYRHAGIHLGPAKTSLVQSRLRNRLRVNNLISYTDYCDLLTSENGKDEFRECVNCITTNETYFFRHKSHWDYFLKCFVPEWIRHNPAETTFRAWSAAASTGEEAHSIALALHEVLPSGRGYRIQIEATDINDAVLAKARRACYSDYALQKLTPYTRKKYFKATPDGRSYQLVDQIRRLVSFERGNLLEQSRGGSFDVIFLRNVLIYFDAESKAHVLNNVDRRLKSKGLLYLGGAEHLNAQRYGYDCVEPTIYRKMGDRQ